MHLTILHDDAVLHMRTGGNAHAARQHRVLHRAFDNAAIRHQRVDDGHIVAIAGGHLVANLGVQAAPL